MTLLEKEHHPRFHIGESLLPHNLPIFERLGVLEQVEAIGIKKPGADFNSNLEVSGHHQFHFSFALDKSQPYAYEVRRSEFDNLLLRNSAAKGAQVLEGVRVTRVDFPKGGDPVVHAVDEQGREAQLDLPLFRRRLRAATRCCPGSSTSSRRTRTTPAPRSSATSATWTGAKASTRATSASTGSSTAGSG